jgi:lauroyl/myristoyl acyltransferase|uniref:Lysophospholipid acyltransferase family protein n=1 Tax=candidate division WOR-3 bacterium TaxID=2052148 RepID=A0A7V3PUS5_UNCW3
MSLLGAVLLLVRVLPPEPAIFITRLLVITYLLCRPDYRKEIDKNFYILLGYHNRFFWLKNAWVVGRNLALMTKIGTSIGDKLIDNMRVYRENITDEIEQLGQRHYVMVSFHFGVWEFLPGIYRNYGNDVAVMTGVMKDNLLHRIIKRIRCSSGVNVIGDVRMLLKRLQQAGITGFMLDNTTRGNQITVRIQKLNIRFPAAAFSMSRRIGIGVIPVFCYLDKGCLTVRVFSPQDPNGCFRILLKMISERPAEWIFWGKSGAINENC